MVRLSAEAQLCHTCSSSWKQLRFNRRGWDALGLWLKFRSKPLTDPLLITSAHTALNCTKNTNRLFGGVVLPNLSPRSLKFTRVVGWLELQWTHPACPSLSKLPLFFISHPSFSKKKKNSLGQFPNRLTDMQLSVFRSTSAPGMQLLVCLCMVRRYFGFPFVGLFPTRGVTITCGYRILQRAANSFPPNGSTYPTISIRVYLWLQLF